MKTRALSSFLAWLVAGTAGVVACGDRSLFSRAGFWRFLIAYVVAYGAVIAVDILRQKRASRDE